MIGSKLDYIIKFLNSKLSQYYFSHNIATSSGVGTMRWLKYTIENLPIPQYNYIYSFDHYLDCDTEKTLYQVYNFDSNEIKFLNDITF